MVRLSQRQILAILVVLGVAAVMMFLPGVAEPGSQRLIFIVAGVSVGALLYGLMGAGPGVEPEG